MENIRVLIGCSFRFSRLTRFPGVISLATSDCDVYSPALASTSSRSLAAIQNPASDCNWSSSGRTAGMRPASFAWKRIPTIPTVLNPSAAAAVRPARSSIRTASAFSATASASASVSPRCRRRFAVSGEGTLGASTSRINDGKTSLRKRGSHVASRSNSARTLGGARTTPNSECKSPARPSKHRFKTTDVSVTTITSETTCVKWRGPRPAIPP